MAYGKDENYLAYKEIMNFDDLIDEPRDKTLGYLTQLRGLKN